MTPDPTGDVISLTTGEADSSAPSFLDLIELEALFLDDGRGPQYRFYISVSEALRARVSADSYSSSEVGIMFMAADGSGAPDLGGIDTGAIAVFSVDFSNSIGATTGDRRFYRAASGWESIGGYSFLLYDSKTELLMSEWLDYIHTGIGSAAEFRQRAVNASGKVTLVAYTMTDHHYDTVTVDLPANLD